MTADPAAANTATPPILMQATRDGARCEVCGHWISSSGEHHDRELHEIAALERIAAALEARA